MKNKNKDSAHQYEIYQKHWEKIKVLAKQPEAEALKTISSLKTPLRVAAAAEKVEAFITAAKKAKLPPHLWMIQRDNGEFINVTWFCLERPGGYALAEECCKLGGSLWSSNAVPMTKSVYTPNTQSNNEMQWEGATGAICYFLQSHGQSLEMQEENAHLLKLVLKDDELKDAHFFDQLLESYRSETKLYVKGVPGTLSKIDQRWVHWSTLLLQFESGLMADLKKKRPEAKKVHGQWEELFERIKLELPIKTKELPREVDYLVLTKDLGLHTEALKKLIQKVDANISDSAWDLQKDLEQATYLTQHPSIASLAIQNYSLIEVAFQNGNVPLIKHLDRLGANLWLASYQGVEPNPVSWLCDLIECSSLRSANEGQVSSVQDEVLEVGTSMLLKGAWLSGATDPVEQCLKMASDVIARYKEDSVDPYVMIARKIRVLIEKNALNEFVKLESSDNQRLEVTDTPKNLRL